MGTKHKHAELIKAWADGADIQFKNSNGNWCDYFSYCSPIWDLQAEYRIKPEPKPDYVRHIGFDHFAVDASTTGMRLQKPLNWAYSIKLTIDGETNEPKAVELIK